MDTKSRTVVAAYSSLERARKVVAALREKNFSRDDIGVAVNMETGEALVAITSPATMLRESVRIVRQFVPIHLNESPAGWRQSGIFQTVGPDTDQFEAVAVKLAEKGDQELSGG